jgi:hypothetical protein
MSSNKHTKNIIDITVIFSLFEKLSDENQDIKNEFQIEFIAELNIILKHILDGKNNLNWDLVNMMIIRLKSLFYLLEDNQTLKYLNEYPNISMDLLNQDQKIECAENVISFISQILIKVDNEM